jgi:hypothetical protein
MDRKISKNQELQRLISLSAAARRCLGNEAAALKQRLDVPSRVRNSLKQNPTGWLLGSLGSGLAASMVFSRKPAPSERKSRSLPSAVLGLTLTAIRPLAKVWLTDQVKNYFNHSLQRQAVSKRSSSDT